MLADQELHRRAGLYAALGDPVRLAVAESLVAGDRTPTSLGAELGVSSNLMAHHVAILVDAGIVTRQPSEADRRRVYLQLTPIGRTALRPSPITAPRVLFVCTHNSARSQFAQALWRRRSDVPVESAGTHPAPRIHPLARKAARRHGLDMTGAVPQLLTTDTIRDALVVSVCDGADEDLSAHETAHLHWSVPDPVGQPESAFMDAFDTIEDRVEQLSHAVTLEDS
ncbi:MAG: helix-turn-helix domain-containing protein [Actinobacteria bacterium]|nr:helix-turn-helix domain-containing protein [Actinomycetota bacterium]MCO5299775.1 helix-turn-helix domain-containing protein [Candidatus Nanopelagicales bacterium]HPE13338.1 helix-turn-helix domain-containing protein [Actinomycetota bacterium]